MDSDSSASNEICETGGPVVRGSQPQEKPEKHPSDAFLLHPGLFSILQDFAFTARQKTVLADFISGHSALVGAYETGQLPDKRSPEFAELRAFYQTLKNAQFDETNANPVPVKVVPQADKLLSYLRTFVEIPEAEMLKLRDNFAEMFPSVAAKIRDRQASQPLSLDEDELNMFDNLRLCSQAKISPEILCLIIPPLAEGKNFFDLNTFLTLNTSKSTFPLLAEFLHKNAPKAMNVMFGYGLNDADAALVRAFLADFKRQSQPKLTPAEQRVLKRRSMASVSAGQPQASSSIPVPEAEPAGFQGIPVQQGKVPEPILQSASISAHVPIMPVSGSDLSEPVTCPPPASEAVVASAAATDAEAPKVHDRVDWNAELKRVNADIEFTQRLLDRCTNDEQSKSLLDLQILYASSRKTILAELAAMNMQASWSNRYAKKHAEEVLFNAFRTRQEKGGSSGSSAGSNAGLKQPRRQDFKSDLIERYEAAGVEPGTIVCMLSGLTLPPTLISASHIVEHKHGKQCLFLHFDDINDPRNGLLLCKPIEHAFDNLKLCFLQHRESGTTLFRCHVLDDELLDAKMDLFAYAETYCPEQLEVLLSQEGRLRSKTFESLDGSDLKLPADKWPFRRGLTLHALRCYDFWSGRGQSHPALQAMEDEYSEDVSDKVQTWRRACQRAMDADRVLPSKPASQDSSSQGSSTGEESRPPKNLHQVVHRQDVEGVPVAPGLFAFLLYFFSENEASQSVLKLLTGLSCDLTGVHFFMIKSTHATTASRTLTKTYNPADSVPTVIVKRPDCSEVGRCVNLEDVKSKLAGYLSQLTLSDEEAAKLKLWSFEKLCKPKLSSVVDSAAALGKPPMLMAAAGSPPPEDDPEVHKKLHVFNLPASADRNLMLKIFGRENLKDTILMSDDLRNDGSQRALLTFNSPEQAKKGCEDFNGHVLADGEQQCKLEVVPFADYCAKYSR